MKYTVRQATATGKDDPKYGTEYIVHFNEDDREVKLSRKEEVLPGREENGTIVDSKYGAYFKKDPFVPGRPQTSTPAPTKGTTSKIAYRDNSDGMRQGMCLNNAANYVNSIPGEIPLTNREWADTVHSYATALYRLGDLPASKDAENVAEVFGAS